jgi:hypothetical protein
MATGVRVSSPTTWPRYWHPLTTLLPTLAESLTFILSPVQGPSCRHANLVRVPATQRAIRNLCPRGHALGCHLHLTLASGRGWLSPCLRAPIGASCPVPLHSARLRDTYRLLIECGNQCDRILPNSFVSAEPHQCRDFSALLALLPYSVCCSVHACSISYCTGMHCQIANHHACFCIPCPFEAENGREEEKLLHLLQAYTCSA